MHAVLATRCELGQLAVLCGCGSAALCPPVVKQNPAGVYQRGLSFLNSCEFV